MAADDEATTSPVQAPPTLPAPIACSDLPLYWEVSYGNGNRFLAWTPDDSSENRWRHWDDVLSPQAWFTHEKGDRVTDIPALLEKSQDAAKTSSSRKANLPSFPVKLPKSLAPEGLKDYLWKSGWEPPVPHQLLNPDPKLLAMENSALSDLAHFISLSTALDMLRTWTKVMAADPGLFSTEEWS